MDFGAHLPLMDFGGNPYTLEHLVSYTQTASRLGFRALSSNDHMVFSVPWLDGPTALAAVIGHSGAMTLATTVSLPVIRGPVPLAKTLAAIDRLSHGRLVVAVGPGSSQEDFDSVGVDFTERWARLDESIGALRALWRAGATPFVGRFYSTAGISLDPHPIRPEGPAIWLGSWGSETGLRRTARLADGWLASAYNTTPTLFAAGWSRLQELLSSHGKDPGSFPNALATMWFYITDNQSEADRSCESGWCRPSTAQRRCSENACQSARPSCSHRNSRPSLTPVSSGCSFGPWLTRRTSSSCSGRQCDQRSPFSFVEPEWPGGFFSSRTPGCPIALTPMEASPFSSLCWPCSPACPSLSCGKC